MVPDEVLLADWVFAKAAFPGLKCDDDTYLERIFHNINPIIKKIIPVIDRRSFKECFHTIRDTAVLFTHKLAEAILCSSPKVVGCSSTFIKHVASLALLRKIRELDDSVVTIIGGSNCETIKGYTTHKCFPWVDYVVSGEADGIIVDLCRKIFQEGREIPPAHLPNGVLGPRHRLHGYTCLSMDDVYQGRLVVNQLDTLPVPDFQDYFDAKSQVSFGERIKPGLLMETARGCWWGSINKCKFCGLNGMGMLFRKKSPNRVISEIRELELKYNTTKLEFVDNILSMNYIQEVLPKLETDGTNRSMFFETKANLTRKDLMQMKRAGVNWLQPGIESLITDVLKIIGKGIAAWQNLQLLKWARELGIRLSWNYLWGFPGEEDGWYRSHTSWLPWIQHLQPPAAFLQFQIRRFSYYFEHAEELGFKLQTVPALDYIYDLSEEDKRGISYYFSSEDWYNVFSDPESSRYMGRPGIQATAMALGEWRRAFWRGVPPLLTMQDNGQRIEFFDTRSCTQNLKYYISGISRYIYLLCDDAPLEKTLLNQFQQHFGVTTSAQELSDMVKKLYQLGVLLKLDNRLIALAIRGKLPRLPGKLDFPGGNIEP